MGKEYEYIVVESFKPIFREASANDIRIRPAYDQGDFKTSTRVECNNVMKDPTAYPVGTKFKIKAKVTEVNGTKFIYSHYTWPYEVLKDNDK